MWPPGILSLEGSTQRTTCQIKPIGDEEAMNTESTAVNDRAGHEEKVTEIVVNGQKKAFEGKDISYRQVVELGFDNPWGNPNVIYTVTYTRGHDDKPQGTLVDGQSAKVKKGMVFNVTRTDKS
jgi:hypothetical protein